MIIEIVKPARLIIDELPHRNFNIQIALVVEIDYTGKREDILNLGQALLKQFEDTLNANSTL